MSERSRLQQGNFDRFLITSHCTVDESKNFVREIYYYRLLPPYTPRSTKSSPFPRNLLIPSLLLPLHFSLLLSNPPFLILRDLRIPRREFDVETHKTEYIRRCKEANHVECQYRERMMPSWGFLSLKSRVSTG